MSKTVFLGVLLLLIFVEAYSKEPECTCSKFHYEKQTIEKIKFQALHEHLDAKLDGFTNTLEAMSKSSSYLLVDLKNRDEDFLTTSGDVINKTKTKFFSETVEGI